MTGLSNSDPIMRDIVHAAKRGHFERRDREGPSKLEAMSVDECLAELGCERLPRPHNGQCYVSRVTAERRRIMLHQWGRLWGESALLSGGKRSKRTRLWLSR